MLMIISNGVASDVNCMLEQGVNIARMMLSMEGVFSLKIGRYGTNL